jgi:hypothetical protein
MVMLNAELMTPHDTREAMYHEALEAFIRTSAGYMDLDEPAASLAAATRVCRPTVDTRESS